MICTYQPDQQVYRCVNVYIIYLSYTHIYSLPDISYRSHVSWRRGHGDIEASGRHWPLHILWGRHCFIIIIKIIWVMSWKKNNRNCLDHPPHCQCRRLILFSLSGAECQDTKCLRCKQATQIWQKNKKGASMCKSSGNCVENKKCERSCVYPSLRILTTSLFVYLLFCQLGLQTVEKRKMDRWNNAF